MFKFGSTGIVTGYIKQLLASFPLPKALIYTDAHARYFEEHGYESPYLLETFPKDIYNVASALDKLPAQNQVAYPSYTPYIKDGLVQFFIGGYYSGTPIDQLKATGEKSHYFKFIPGIWQSAPFDLSDIRGGKWQVYERGSEIPNLTKTFQIKNNVYDSYTHEYLGDYLRFLRDYDNIDLMPLYNCFSNTRPFITKPLVIEKFLGGSDFVIDTSDENYKIYSLPVKLFQNYTIAIDSAYPVEICCCFSSNNLLMTESSELIKRTYVKLNSSQFNQPFLYTGLTDLAAPIVTDSSVTDEYLDHLDKRNFLASIAGSLPNLRMIIKLSKHTSSSITVLEGNYCAWNDFSVKLEDSSTASKRLVKQVNHTVIANEGIFATSPITLITPLQLLQFNTGAHIPFADRLLEYLLDQCVTGGEDEVRENVLMAQRLAGLRHAGLVESIRNKAPKKPRLARSLNPSTGEYTWILNGINTKVIATSETPVLTIKDNVWHIDGRRTEAEVQIQEFKTTPVKLEYNITNGVWSEPLRRIFYRYMSTQPDFSLTPDTLGYVDKDVEEKFVAQVRDKKTGRVSKQNMLNFNVWEDIDE